MKFRYLLMIILLCAVSQARAVGSYYNGNELLELCEAYHEENITTITKANIYEALDCVSYIKGIVDMHETFVELGSTKQHWCFTENVKADQLVHITVKYLQEHPEALHLTAGFLTATALYLAFPCTDK